jgi:hypothetical protein
VDFAKTVRAIVVESANPIHQGLLDRFILDGVDMSREELAPVWRDASNAEVWECPIYEAFLRAVHDVNRKLPRPERVRVLGGDSKIDWPRIERAEQLAPLLNRGANIRRIVAEEILDKHVKALAIYGSGHCVKIGGGFPGELADRYGIARMWCVWPLESAEEVKLAKTVLGFGAEPAYAAVAGTAWASRSASVLETLPADLTIGEVVDALVHHGVHDGESADRVVKADLAALEAKMGPELERRARLTREAVQLVKQRR